MSRSLEGIIDWRYPNVREEAAFGDVPLPRPRPLASLAGQTEEVETASVSPSSVPVLREGEEALDLIHKTLAYLVRTASPGYTMERLGEEHAIACLHPEFRRRLADAIRDARSQGIDVGIFSACRPPSFGVGGFRDKFNSLHSVGLAVDVSGIGRPGSVSARRFHQIASRHGVYCVYGPFNRAEWNHCQGTRIFMTTPELRRTITARGPRDLEMMWRVAARYIDRGPPLGTRVARRVRTHHLTAYRAHGEGG